MDTKNCLSTEKSSSLWRRRDFLLCFYVFFQRSSESCFVDFFFRRKHKIFCPSFFYKIDVVNHEKKRKINNKLSNWYLWLLVRPFWHRKRDLLSAGISETFYRLNFFFTSHFRVMKIMQFYSTAKHFFSRCAVDNVSAYLWLGTTSTESSHQRHLHNAMRKHTFFNYDGHRQAPGTCPASPCST